MKIKLSHVILAGGICIAASAFVIDKTKPKKKYIDRANMDLSVKPGDDFFEYANGTWVKNNPIPAKQTRWGAFNVLAQENIDRLVGILNEVSRTPGQPKGSVKQRVGDLYASAMDSVAIEKRGYDPIKPDLERIATIKTTDDVINEMVYERTRALTSPFFGFGVGADAKHPNVNIVNFSQGGTTLPDRDYYLKDDARTIKIQNTYKQYIVTLFTLTGTDAKDAAKNADVIVFDEIDLTKNQELSVDELNATLEILTIIKDLKDSQKKVIVVLQESSLKSLPLWDGIDSIFALNQENVIKTHYLSQDEQNSLRALEDAFVSACASSSGGPGSA